MPVVFSGETGRLPIIQPTKFELAVNLKLPRRSADHPRVVLLRADGDRINPIAAVHEVVVALFGHSRVGRQCRC